MNTLSLLVVCIVEMEECVQAGKYERNAERVGHRSGYYRRRLIT